MKKNDDRMQRFLAALVDCDGIIAHACKRVGISRNTFYYWRDSDDDFRRAYNDANEDILDDLEAELRSIAHDEANPDRFKALCKILEAKARDRGYGAHAVDVTTGGQPLPPCKIVWIDTPEQIPAGYDY